MKRLLRQRILWINISNIPTETPCFIHMCKILHLHIEFIIWTIKFLNPRKFSINFYFCFYWLHITNYVNSELFQILLLSNVIRQNDLKNISCHYKGRHLCYDLLNKGYSIQKSIIMVFYYTWGSCRKFFGKFLHIRQYYY